MELQDKNETSQEEMTMRPSWCLNLEISGASERMRGLEESRSQVRCEVVLDVLVKRYLKKMCSQLLD